MITSVYLSNNIIQIVQGEKSTKLPAISRVINEEIPEGSLLNGIITNEQELYEQLKEIWQRHKLPLKGVEVVLNSAKISSKNITAPTAKAKQIMKTLPLDFADVSQNEAVIYDYARLGKSGQKGLYELLAVMVEEAQINSFVDVFSKMGIE